MAPAPLSQCLMITRISKWGLWLVGCGEDMYSPFRLILKDEEFPEFVGPEETFVWPINENSDEDNVMLGMGVDFSVPVPSHLSPSSSLRQTVVCSCNWSRQMTRESNADAMLLSVQAKMVV